MLCGIVSLQETLNKLFTFLAPNFLVSEKIPLLTRKFSRIIVKRVAPAKALPSKTGND